MPLRHEPSFSLRYEDTYVVSIIGKHRDDLGRGHVFENLWGGGESFAQHPSHGSEQFSW